MRGIYLDNNATSPPLRAVQEAVLEAMQHTCGNPSSAHAAGDAARGIVESARREIASLIGAAPTQIFFFSGGTEANNTVLHSAAHYGKGPNHIISSMVEHPSILRALESLACRGTEVTLVDVNAKGRVSLPDLSTALQRGAQLVSIQWANNETGTIQPIEEIAALCLKYCAPFHCDAAQAVGRVPMSFGNTHVDYLTFSGHKLHGPIGVGGLAVREPSTLRPLLHGGSQEHGLRPGTENVPALAGFAEAARQRRLNLQTSIDRLAELRDFFEQEVLRRIPTALVNGSRDHRLVNTTSIRFPGIDGQALVARLDQDGVRCSQSSACTNARPEPSHVLKAMGLTETEAYESLRFSVSVENTLEELREAVGILEGVHKQLAQFESLQSPPARRPEIN